MYEMKTMEEHRSELLHLIHSINRLQSQVDRIMMNFLTVPDEYNVTDKDCEESEVGLCVYPLPITSDTLDETARCIYCNKKVF